MSPEQCRGQRRRSPHRHLLVRRARRIALLTGAYPFDGDYHGADDQADLTSEAAAARRAQRAGAARVRSIDAIAWMMQKDPAERPPRLAPRWPRSTPTPPRRFHRRARARLRSRCETALRGCRNARARMRSLRPQSRKRDLALVARSTARSLSSSWRLACPSSTCHATRVHDRRPRQSPRQHRSSPPAPPPITPPPTAPPPVAAPPSDPAPATPVHHAAASSPKHPKHPDAAHDSLDVIHLPHDSFGGGK